MIVLLVISAFFYNSFIQAIPSVSFFYPKNLTSSACTGDYSWTTWFNTFKPQNVKDFDQEILSVIESTYGKNVCHTPKGIQARTVTPLNVNISYELSWKTLNGIISACISRTPGVDFQVRFCCPNRDFITTTTTPPRPVDNPKCGRTQIEPSFQSVRIFGGSRAVPHSWPWVSEILLEQQSF